MPRQLSANEYSQIVARGPRAEYVPAQLLSDIAAITTIAASDNWTSELYSADGYYNIVIGLTSSQSGALNLLRYVDDAGAVLLDGTAPTAALTAATAAVLVSNDGKPFASWKVQITNTGESAATISDVAALMSA
jgi:hypothetical protein